MVKRFVDINELIKYEEMPDGLEEYERIMQEKPNFVKKNDTSKKVYENGEFIILEVKSSNRKGYILQNTSKDSFRDSHTHLHSFSIAKTILSNVKNNKLPKTHDIYLLKSHIRVSNNERYINQIEQLIETRSNKSKHNYKNVNSKKIRK